MFNFSEFFIYKANTLMAIQREDGYSLSDAACPRVNDLDEFRSFWGYDCYDIEGPTHAAKLESGHLKLKNCDIFGLLTNEQIFKVRLSSNMVSDLHIVLNSDIVESTNKRLHIIVHWYAGEYTVSTIFNGLRITGEPSYPAGYFHVIDTSITLEVSVVANVIRVIANKGFSNETESLCAYSRSINFSQCFSIATAEEWSVDNLERVINFDASSNPLDFGIATVGNFLCDIDHGTVFMLDRMWSQISIWLYEALSEYVLYQDVIIRTLGLAFPSGAVLSLVVNNQVEDFRHYPNKYWATQITSSAFNYKSAPIPLPNIELTDKFLLSALSVFNDGIPGTENWYFKDKDSGEIKLGTEFLPVRQYHPISDGVVDVETINIVISIAVLLQQLGLVKLAVGLVSKAIASYRARQLRSSVDDVSTQIDTLEEVVNALPVDEVLSTVKGLGSKIGLRFTLT